MSDIQTLLGDEAEYLLGHRSNTISSDLLQLPGPDYVDRVLALSDRPIGVLRNLQTMFDHGRLGGTGYLSILPVDQGVEHCRRGLVCAEPDLLRSRANIVELAMAGGCNAVASTLGVLGSGRAALRPQDPVPGQTQPQRAADLPDHLRPDPVRQCRAGLRHGRGGGGRDHLLRGSAESRRQIMEISEAFQRPTSWAWSRCSGPICATAPSSVTASTTTTAADLTGQANHLAVTIEADIVKQKQATCTAAIPPSASARPVRSSTRPVQPAPHRPVRYQVANCYMGRIGMINSGGASSGAGPGRGDAHGGHQQACRWHGLISGRKAFQRPMAEGVALLHAIQDVYLSEQVTIA
jgi:class I fructose-bisphosphate aldolase